MKNIKNKLFIILGTIFLILGVVGIFVPLLPSTIFLLLAAACYARGSQKFYNWLMNNRWLGSTIRDYREGRGILLRQKLLTMILLWLTIGSSAYYFVEQWWVKMILIGIAIGVSTHLMHVRTRPVEEIHKHEPLGIIPTIPEKKTD